MLAPSARVKTPEWDIKYGVSYSTSAKYWEYSPENRHYDAPARGVVTAQIRGGLGWTINRAKSLEWPTIDQTAGKDIYDLSNYTNTVRANFLDKGVSDTVMTARFDARRDLNLRVPVWLKAGVNVQQQDRRSWINSRQFNHVGPDGIAGNADDNLAAFFDTTGKWGDANEGYRGPPWPNPFTVLPDVLASPKAWTEDLAYRAEQHALGNRFITERVSAVYLMGNARWKQLNVLGGLRVERTETDAEGPLSTGTPARVTGRQAKTGEYQDVFPGIHVKYTPDRHFVGRASYSTSIGRPAFGSIIPLDSVNDVNQTVTTANTALRPQFTDNFDVSLEYYFEPTGIVSASAFLKEVDDFQFTDSSQTIGSGADNGFDGQYAGYRINTMRNGGHARYRGLEFSYQQQFTFLPGYWRGLGTSLSYTKLDTHGDYGGRSATSQVAGFIPESGNAAITYVFDRLNLRVSAFWRGEYLVGSAANPGLVQYGARKLQASVNTKYTISPRLSIFLDIYNLNKSPNTQRYQVSPDRPTQTIIEVPKYIAGIKGRF